MFSSQAISTLPISSTIQMVKTHNGLEEIFLMPVQQQDPTTLSIQMQVAFTLPVDKLRTTSLES